MIKIKEETRKAVADLLTKFEKNIPRRISLESIDRRIENMDYEEFYEELSIFSKLPDQMKKFKYLQEVSLKVQRNRYFDNILSEIDRDFLVTQRGFIITRLKYSSVTDQELQDLFITYLIINSLLPSPIHQNKVVEGLIASIHHAVAMENYRVADRMILELEGYL